MCDITYKTRQGLYFSTNPFPKSEVGPILGSLISDFRISAQGFLVSPVSLCEEPLINMTLFCHEVVFSKVPGLFYFRLHELVLLYVVICYEEVIGTVLSYDPRGVSMHRHFILREAVLNKVLSQSAKMIDEIVLYVLQGGPSLTLHWLPLGKRVRDYILTENLLMLIFCEVDPYVLCSLRRMLGL